MEIPLLHIKETFTRPEQAKYFESLQKLRKDERLSLQLPITYRFVLSLALVVQLSDWRAFYSTVAFFALHNTAISELLWVIVYTGILSNQISFYKGLSCMESK